jgi:hypothetical protein
MKFDRSQIVGLLGSRGCKLRRFAFIGAYLWSTFFVRVAALPTLAAQRFGASAVSTFTVAPPHAIAAVKVL